MNKNRSDLKCEDEYKDWELKPDASFYFLKIQK